MLPRLFTLLAHPAIVALTKVAAETVILVSVAVGILILFMRGRS
jgi:hypothetical protein